MASYTYLAADLRTNAILAELPLKGVSFDLVLNGIGGLTGLLPLGDARVTRIDPIASTQPTRTALYVDRDGVLVWGGIIWTRRYDSDKKGLEIGASDFLSYFNRRKITDTKTYAAQDQLFIFRDLLTYAKGKPGGDIGITIGTETCGTLRDRTYYDYEQKPIYDAIKQLSEVDGGFDFAVDVAYSAGVPTKTLTFGFPRRGRIVGSTGHVFDFPGNITHYQWPEDGTRAANSFTAIGQGQGTVMLRSVASQPSQIDAGFPLLEDDKSFKDVTVRTTLDAHARAGLNALVDPVTLPMLDVRADADPVFGSYITGDDARFRIVDERFATALDTYYRITAIAVRPPDDGQAEQVTLTTGKAG